MAQAKMTDVVTVHYTGFFTDGTVFDSSMDREPLTFTIGQGMVIPGFENGIVGMAVGDTKKINIAAEDAYGLHRDDLLTVIGRSQIPASIDLKAGSVLQVRSPDGGITSVIIRDITDENVTLDLNHPMADKELIFEIQLVEISQA